MPNNIDGRFRIYDLNAKQLVFTTATHTWFKIHIILIQVRCDLICAVERPLRLDTVTNVRFRLTCTKYAQYSQYANSSHVPPLFGRTFLEY